MHFNSFCRINLRRKRKNDDFYSWPRVRPDGPDLRCTFVYGDQKTVTEKSGRALISDTSPLEKSLSTYILINLIV